MFNVIGKNAFYKHFVRIVCVDQLEYFWVKLDKCMCTRNSLEKVAACCSLCGMNV